MESYDVFLIGNFLALPAFRNRYGIYDAATDSYVIVTKWQSALQCSGQLGALIGVMLAGSLTSRVGYRWATIIGLMLLNATIFVSFFADSLPVFFAGQLLEGIPWGIFIANAPAYCSEIVPLRLRAPCTQMLQMFWAVGSIIVGAVTYVYNARLDSSAYKYVPAPQCSCQLTKAGFRLLFNGCFPLRSQSSFSFRPSHHGGWSEWTDRKRQFVRSSVSDVDHA
jgi:SP family general alpha glucoside:H+ symporter-like MFS transporter